MGPSEARDSGAKCVRIHVRNSYAKSGHKCCRSATREGGRNTGQDDPEKDSRQKEDNKGLAAAKRLREDNNEDAAKSASFLHLSLRLSPAELLSSVRSIGAQQWWKIVPKMRHLGSPKTGHFGQALAL